MSAKKYWFAFGIGIVAGAAIALLYAPQTGVKTRKRLKRGISEAGDYLEDAGDYLKSQAERLSRDAQSALQRTRSQVEDAVDSVSDLASSAMKQAKSLV